MDSTLPPETPLNKQIIRFLPSQGHLVALLVAVTVIHQLIGGLVGLPYMVYAAMLSMAVLLVILTIRFIVWREREAMLTHVSAENSELLQQYIAEHGGDSALLTIEEMARRIRDCMSQRRAAHQSQQEYFSLWLHQIKSPLAAMALLLEKEQGNAESIIQLRQERLRIEDYIYMALNYLKLESPGADLEIERVAVDEIIRHVLKKYRILFIEGHIGLQYQPTELLVITDGHWLEVVIEQILSNSLKYAIGGLISINVHPSEPHSLIITDNGPGIPPEELARVFQKGYSGSVGRFGKQSTGLGLFLCQRICQRLGHRLHLESTLGVGTRAILEMNDAPNILTE